MFVNEDFTISSPLEDTLDVSYDLWTEIRRTLTSQRPDTVILIDHSTGAAVMAREFLTKVDCLAANLVRHGFNRRVPVTIFMANCPEYVYLLCAVWHLGGLTSTINALSVSADITKYMHLLESEFLFCDNYTAPAAVEGVKGMSVKKIFVNGDHPGCVQLASLLKPAPLPAREIQPLTPQDVAFVLFSSGTTGFPKGVELRHYGLTKWIGGFSKGGINIKKYALIYQPFSHTYGLALAILALITAKPIILLHRFDMDEYIKCVIKYQIDHLFLVPPIAVLFTKGGYSKKYDLSHVTQIFCGAAPLSDEVRDNLLTQFHNKLKIINLYAMTECPATFHPSSMNLAEAPKGSVGLPFPGTKFKVVDITTGASLEPMKQGEICIYTKAKMKGYIKNREATENMIDKEDWLHTGDIGYYDKVGYIFIVDRLKELIKYEGLQVPPAELENVLLSHPDIADAGVTGLPDELAGELPFAYIVVKPGSKLTAEDVHAFVNDKVARYKQLRGGVKFVQQIPKSPSGKILRRVIKLEQTGKKSVKP